MKDIHILYHTSIKILRLPFTVRNAEACCNDLITQESIHAFHVTVFV